MWAPPRRSSAGPGRLAGATTEARSRSRRATLPSGAFEDAGGERLAIVRPRQQVPLRQLSRPSHVLARSAADPRPSPHPHRSRRTATDQAPARQQCGGARHLDRGGGHRHDRWRGGAERAALSVVVFHTGVEWSREEAVGRRSSIRYSSIWKATATRQLPSRLPAAGAATPGSGARRSGARPAADILPAAALRRRPAGAVSRSAPEDYRRSAGRLRLSHGGGLVHILLTRSPNALPAPEGRSMRVGPGDLRSRDVPRRHARRGRHEEVRDGTAAAATGRRGRDQRVHDQGPAPAS